ncbi:MAG TPA: YraN family protein [Terriglobia bacterium]|jgi:putative endonuclease
MPFPLLLHRLLTFGRRSEILAIDHLRSLGYRIVTSPYRTKAGEVDVIAWEGNILAFIEVKARKNEDPPEDSVGVQKQQRVIRAANAYISRYRLHDKPCRFDILAVTAIPGRKPEFRLLRDAFHS